MDLSLSHTRTHLLFIQPVCDRWWHSGILYHVCVLVPCCCRSPRFTAVVLMLGVGVTVTRVSLSVLTRSARPYVYIRTHSFPEGGTGCPYRKSTDCNFFQIELIWKCTLRLYSGLHRVTLAKAALWVLYSYSSFIPYLKGINIFKTWSRVRFFLYLSQIIWD